jgi:probable DNA metabolism protein
MTTLVYDGSFAGWLTTVFEVYERKLGAVQIVKEGATQQDVFADTLTVDTNEVKARRVWAGLGRKLSAEGMERVHSVYLSEEAGMEAWLLQFVRYVLAAGKNIEEDYGHPAVLWVTQTARRVWREKHRMEAFVRFRKLADGLFYAFVEPDCDVLPLIAPHFRSRYADQDWLIYDGKRRYGIHYQSSGGTVTRVQLEWTEGSSATGAVPEEVLDERESMFQALWKDYFRNTGIPARRNPKLHLRHMPLRYWKHLTEKGMP